MGPKKLKWGPGSPNGDPCGSSGLKIEAIEEMLATAVFKNVRVDIIAFDIRRHVKFFDVRTQDLMMRVLQSAQQQGILVTTRLGRLTPPMEDHFTVEMSREIKANQLPDYLWSLTKAKIFKQNYLRHLFEHRGHFQSCIYDEGTPD